MASAWQLLNGSANAGLPDHWTVKLVPTDPSMGAQMDLFGQDPWKAMAVKALPKHSLIPEEAYTREQDLIVRFGQSSVDTFAFQLNWRLIETGKPNISCVELWASVQTNLLDAEPLLVISSLAPQGNFWEIYQHEALLPSGGAETGEGSSADTNALESASMTKTDGPAALVSHHGNVTGLWFIGPTDQQNTQLLSSPADREQQIELFGHFMEKGVIRRARLRFYLVDGHLTDTQLRQYYQEFASSPLPLTA